MLLKNSIYPSELGGFFRFGVAMQKLCPFRGGPVDGAAVVVEEGKEPTEIEFRISEGVQLFPFYVFTEFDEYLYLRTNPQPQPDCRYFVDLAPVNTVVGKGRLKTKLSVWAMVEELTEGG